MDTSSASLSVEMPVQGEDQDMLVRDKDVIRTFEDPPTWASGTIVAILNGSNHPVGCNRRELVFKRDRVRLDRLLGTGDKKFVSFNSLRTLPRAARGSSTRRPVQLQNQPVGCPPVWAPPAPDAYERS